MKSMHAYILIMGLMVVVGAYGVTPDVSNVQAQQRTDGSHLVDIHYDLADSDSDSLTVTVRVSDNDGLTFSIAPHTLTGDVGDGVTSGTGKHIIWDCGADLPGAYGTDYRVAVTADDHTASAWQQLSVVDPPACYGHALAYDAARGKVVLFGGKRSGGSLFADTWEWDGTEWSEWGGINTTTPPARSYHALAYDAARGKVVLFGGRGNSYFGDTWEWDGSEWVQVSVSGPSVRRDHAMAYDAARGKVVLFGGYSDSNVGDTWEWDGSEWVQVSVSGPSARAEHALAYDAARGKVVLFGGLGNIYFGDTWVYGP